MAGLGLAVLVAVLAGPRERIDPAIRRPELPADLDAYLARSEAAAGDLVPGTEKTIVWARPDRARTPLAVVYLHGFSATRQETAPLADRVAARFGANLFYTRLTGHGVLDDAGRALAAARADDWLDDAAEALAIGRRLGDRVVVIGTSTGGTLAAWLATRPEGEAAAAYVLLSPNFALRDGRARVLTLPWARQVVPRLFGRERSWQPTNAAHARYWTSRYPTEALVSMMALVSHVAAAPLERVRAPVLVLYSPRDEVVDPAAIREAFGRLGSDANEMVAIEDSADPQSHVLAGDALAPGDTERVAGAIVRFVDGARRPLRNGGRRDLPGGGDHRR